MKKLAEDGSILMPHEYCVINNIAPITKDDCFCYINGDASSIVSYFYSHFNDINLTGPYNDLQFNVWKSFCFSKEKCEEIINESFVLKEINKILKISKCMILEVSPNSFLAWHHDYPVKGPVLNLLITTNHRSHSLFTYNIPNTSNLVECLYKPNQFCLYNTDMIHSILNFEKPRYIFSAIFEKGESEELDWTTAKEILKDFLC